MTNQINGASVLLEVLLKEKVELVFGYIGGAIMPLYDALLNYKEIKHITTKHEQGAIHAAQGYARSKNSVGVCFTTSGPGATNILTGLADAMMDSTPLVCITGQVNSSLLGSDAFQEQFMTGLALPVTKWCTQVTKAEDVGNAITKAFAIARSGRPGPVLVDLTKDAQVALTDFFYIPYFNTKNSPRWQKKDLEVIATLINRAKKPMVIAGQGVILAQAQKELKLLCEKIQAPVGLTLLGRAALESKHKLNVGMVGMHGNYAPNLLNRDCDLLMAIGMRFDDRVTSKVSEFAPNAKIIHIDIDNSEIDKIVKTSASVCGDAREVLQELLPLLSPVYGSTRESWLNSFKEAYQVEYKKVISAQLKPHRDQLSMGEVVDFVSNITKGNAVVVTDVGQNQMMAARYFSFTKDTTFITSGGLGTMGFGLPAAIGAKLANPHKSVVLFVGDGGLQMTLQELAMVKNLNLGIKIVLLNNNFLGMVRQWQELFFQGRYSQTKMSDNPDFVAIGKAFGLRSIKISSRDQLEREVDKMLLDNCPCLLEVMVKAQENVFPMIPAGEAVSKIRLE